MPFSRNTNVAPSAPQRLLAACRTMTCTVGRSLANESCWITLIRAMVLAWRLTDLRQTTYTGEYRPMSIRQSEQFAVAAQHRRHAQTWEKTGVTTRHSSVQTNPPTHHSRACARTACASSM